MSDVEANGFSVPMSPDSYTMLAASAARAQSDLGVYATRVFNEAFVDFVMKTSPEQVMALGMLGEPANARYIELDLSEETQQKLRRVALGEERTAKTIARLALFNGIDNQVAENVLRGRSHSRRQRRR